MKSLGFNKSGYEYKVGSDQDVYMFKSGLRLGFVCTLRAWENGFNKTLSR